MPDRFREPARRAPSGLPTRRDGQTSDCEKISPAVHPTEARPGSVRAHKGVRTPAGDWAEAEIAHSCATRPHPAPSRSVRSDNAKRFPPETGACKPRSRAATSSYPSAHPGARPPHRRQLAPALAVQHPIDGGERHRPAQVGLQRRLDRRHHHPPPAFASSRYGARKAASCSGVKRPRRRPPRDCLGLSSPWTIRSNRRRNRHTQPGETPIAAAVCRRVSPSSKGKTTACAIFNSSTFRAVSRTALACANTARPPAGSPWPFTSERTGRYPSDREME
jgi:hypothetical protein